MQALMDLDYVTYSRGFAVEHTKYKLYEVGQEHFGPVEVWDRKKDIPQEVLDLFKGVSATQEGVYLSPDGDYSLVVEKIVEPLENALFLVKSTLEEILVNTKATSYRGFLSGEGNFRDKIATIKPYKGNRDKLHKPKWYNEIREYLVGKWKAEVINGMEADDALAMAQSAHYGVAGKPEWGFHFLEEDRDDPCTKCTIICTVDKDLDQVPGWHYNLTTKEKYWVTEQEALYNFYMQLLTGDPVDNIQGCPGIGEAKAGKILEGCRTEEEMYKACWGAYEEALLKKHPVDQAWMPDAVDMVVEENAKLLFLLRHEKDEWKAPV